MNRQTDVLGYLTFDKLVVCVECGSRLPYRIGPALFHANVFPYSQRCHVCDKVLVKGLHSWPEMFESPVHWK